MPELPVIPDYITVHLGRPDANAENVTVRFPDYIKNVASGEVYPTWPENALRANILAQVSYALNRVYTEWYRSRGYPFDITGSTQYDQSYEKNREVFQNISELVDELFNDYLTREGNVEPLFAAFCNGTTVRCDGLSQWGTVPLAEQGKTPYEILQRYYGDDIGIVFNAPVGSPISTYPGTALRLGTTSEDVRKVQQWLGRISKNFPQIPKIPDTNGTFDKATEDAVREFQRVFDLTADGVVGKSTWYKIRYIYTAVKGLAELGSEGLSLAEVSRQFPRVLQLGDRGDYVKIMQYYLRFVSRFYDSVPNIAADGIYGADTQNAVLQFQKTFGLTQDGIVGRDTWNKLYDVYLSLVENVDVERSEVPPFGGKELAVGSSGAEVRQLQQWINVIASRDSSVPTLSEDGVYGNATRDAVELLQRRYGLTSNPGVTGPLTWQAIGENAIEIILTAGIDPRQYAGNVIKREE